MAPSAVDVASSDATTTTPFDPARPLAGKVALITGAGRGIGKGIAIELGRRGADIVVNYGSSAKSAEEVVSELAKLGSKGVALQADISDPASVSGLFDKAIEHFGYIDFVISNSGMEVWCPEVDVTPELFDKVFGLNTRGQFFVAQHALKHCRRGGRLVLTSSIAASIGGIPNHALYAGSKAAIEGFTRAFAVDCGEKGMTVNAIAPGGVKTDMFDENAWHYVPGGYKDMPMDIIDKGLANMCPLKRVGTPADIGKAVFTLCSDEGEWINGTCACMRLHTFLLLPSPSPVYMCGVIQSLLTLWRRSSDQADRRKRGVRQHSTDAMICTANSTAFLSWICYFLAAFE
jgi:3-oxoacyl-[acyl-carrier protein] reductase